MTDAAAPKPAPAPLWTETPAERALLERDMLYLPDSPPPSLERLASSRLLRRINTIRTIRRASRNLLDMVHPDLAHRRWHATRVGPMLVKAAPSTTTDRPSPPCRTRCWRTLPLRQQ